MTTTTSNQTAVKSQPSETIATLLLILAMLSLTLYSIYAISPVRGFDKSCACREILNRYSDNVENLAHFPLRYEENGNIYLEIPGEELLLQQSEKWLSSILDTIERGCPLEDLTPEQLLAIYLYKSPLKRGSKQLSLLYNAFAFGDYSESEKALLLENILSRLECLQTAKAVKDVTGNIQ